MPLDIVEGWTAAIELRLLSEGAPENLTGMSVALVLRDVIGNRAIYTTSAGAEATCSTGGLVAYTPGSTHLVSTAGPYQARVRVTDGAGKVVFFPNGAADTWTVHSQ